jgi:hypothetical protein
MKANGQLSSVCVRREAHVPSRENRCFEATRILRTNLAISRQNFRQMETSEHLARDARHDLTIDKARKQPAC